MGSMRICAGSDHTNVASSVVLSHESVFSGLRASFVRRWPFKPFNRCAPFKPFKPTSALRVQSSNTLYPAAVKSILDPSALLRTGFGFRPNHRSNLRNQFAMRHPLFSLFIFSTKFRLPTVTASDHRASRTDNSSRRRRGERKRGRKPFFTSLSNQGARGGVYFRASLSLANKW